MIPATVVSYAARERLGGLRVRPTARARNLLLVPTPSRTSTALLGAAVAGIEAAALVALAVAYAVGLGAHTEASGPRTLASMALFLVGAMILGAVARAYLRVLTWQRMASLVANALLIPVSLSVVRGNGPIIGVPVLALAIGGVAAALLTRGHDDAALLTRGHDDAAG